MLSPHATIPDEVLVEAVEQVERALNVAEVIPVPKRRRYTQQQQQQQSQQQTIGAAFGAADHRVLRRVVSGGQTGADRAALEAARAVGLQTGGWILRGFLTSDGPRPELGTVFGLRELAGNVDRSLSSSVARAYVERSKRNVDDSDATIAIRLCASRGTDRTIGYAQTRRWQDGVIDNETSSAYRPCLVITSLDDANVDAIVDFVARHRVRTLNVAGHRASTVSVVNFSDRVQRLLTTAFLRCRRCVNHLI